MKSIINNKKGMFDLPAIIVSVFIIAFLGLVVLLVIGKFTDVASPLVDEGSTAYAALEKQKSIFFGGLDNLFLGIFIILLIGMVILAFYIRSSPIFIPIYLIIAAISVWFAAIISNAYQMTQATGVFADVLDFLAKQNFIMENLPYFIAGFAFILLIVTYSKDIFFPRQEIQQ